KQHTGSHHKSGKSHRNEHKRLFHVRISDEDLFTTPFREVITGFLNEGWYDALWVNAFQESNLMRKRIVLVCAFLGVACIAASAPESQDTFYSAIRANDLRQIRTLLDMGVSPNAPGPDGITPLMAAAETGSVEAMKLLIDHHADLNAKNTYGSTALMLSVTD